MSRNSRTFCDIVSATSTAPLRGTACRRALSRDSRIADASASVAEDKFRTVIRGALAGGSRGRSLLARLRTASSAACPKQSDATSRHNAIPRSTARIITRENESSRLILPLLATALCSLLHFFAGDRRGLEHVIREEELAVIRNHHDLDLVRKLLGDDFLNQQRILLEHIGLQPHALRICLRHVPDTVRFAFGHELPLLQFRLAVDYFRLSHGLGVLHRSLLAG